MSHPAIASYIPQGGPKVVYHADAHPKYINWIRTLSFFTGNWLAPCTEITERTYVTVYENKIEYGAPIPACCCCMYDVTSTVYLDRALASKTMKAAACTPCCTHCSLFPTCCDACGQGVVIYGADCCVTRRVLEPGVGSCIPCRGWMMLCGVKNADELAANINHARDQMTAKLAGGGGALTAAPGVPGMARA